MNVWVWMGRASVGMALLLAAFLVGLHSGVTDGFEGLEQAIQASAGFSSPAGEALLSVGILGLYASLPAGVAVDRLGYGPVVFLGAWMVGCPLIAAAFLPLSLWPMLYGLLLVCGFGCGATLTAALAAAVDIFPDWPGVALAVVETGMALSMAVPQIVRLTTHALGFSWRGALLALGVQVLLAMLAAWALLQPYECRARLFPASPQEDDEIPAPSAHVLEEVDKEEDASLERPTRRLFSRTDVLHDFRETAASFERAPPLSLRQSLREAGTPFFLSLTLANAAGMGAGILVITGAETLWASFGGSSEYPWAPYVIIAFTALNAVGGLLVAAFSDGLADSLPRTWVFAAMLLGAAALDLGLAVLLAVGGASLLVLHAVYFGGLALCGLFFAANITLMPAVISTVYSPANFGTFFSWCQVGVIVSALCVPPGASLLQSLSQFGFSIMLAILALAQLVGLTLLLLFRPPPFRLNTVDMKTLGAYDGVAL